MSTPASVLGPCTTWVDADDLTCLDSGVDGTLVAAAASQLLWSWSGRQFDGACTQQARPCGNTDCFGGVSVAAMRWNLNAWIGRDDQAVLCGCTAYRAIPLSGYPIQSVDEVTIDGDVVDPAVYRLDEQGRLVRTDNGWWPACQDLRAAPGDPGSFVVTYTSGVDPPASGVLAAGELACYLYTASTRGECDLPASTTGVARQGIAMTLTDATTGQAKSLPLVSAFLDSTNPHRLPRRGAFWSPDVEPFAR